MPCMALTFSSRALLKVSQNVLDEVTGVFSVFAGCKRKAIVKIEILAIGSRIQKRLDLQSPIALNSEILLPVPRLPWCRVSGCVKQGDDILGSGINQSRYIDVGIFPQELSTKVRQFDANFI